jgi:type IV pilus assembly protein PilA
MMNLQRRRRGFFLIELLIVIAIILIIITIARPKFSSAQRYAKETSALGAIRTIHTMQVQYYSQYGKYATSLTELGPPASGAEGPAAANLIDSTLASGEKGGYKFTLVPAPGAISSMPRPSLSASAEAVHSTPTNPWWSGRISARNRRQLTVRK